MVLSLHPKFPDTQQVSNCEQWLGHIYRDILDSFKVTTTESSCADTVEETTETIMVVLVMYIHHHNTKQAPISRLDVIWITILFTPKINRNLLLPLKLLKHGFCPFSTHQHE